MSALFAWGNIEKLENGAAISLRNLMMVYTFCFNICLQLDGNRNLHHTSLTHEYRFPLFSEVDCKFIKQLINVSGFKYVILKNVVISGIFTVFCLNLDLFGPNKILGTWITLYNIPQCY